MLAVIGVAVGLTLSSAAPAQNEGVRALAVQYADGRRTVTPLSPSGRVSWTPAFPRIDGADTSRDGLPLFAIQYEEAREPGGVAVTVALLYGRPHERRVPVATVHVTGPDPVRVDALEAFGVRPVTFALAPLPPTQLLLPSVTTPSSSLEAFVETATDPAPAYHVTIVNHGDRDVMMLHFMSYNGRRPGVTGRPRGSGRLPLIGPGDAYVLTVKASTTPGRDGVPQWVPCDRIEIDSVLWSDDVVEGDGKPAADEHALDAGVALQLDRILVVLREAATNPAAHSLVDLRAAIAALPLVVTREEAETAAAAIPGSVRLPVPQVNATMAAGMRNARNAVLNDFDDLLQGPAVTEPSAYAGWLSRTAEKYRAWRGRIN